MFFSTKTAENLKKHIYTIHKDHKDYRCEDCVKPFSNVYEMKKHVYRIHIEKNDKCDICGKLVKESKLRKHMISIHSINLRHLF